MKKNQNVFDKNSDSEEVEHVNVTACAYYRLTNGWCFYAGRYKAQGPT